MGQTYMVVNVDKKHFFAPLISTAYGFRKFLEFWDSGDVAQALSILLSVGQGLGGGDLQVVDPLVGEWVGDKIAILGEYAEFNGINDESIDDDWRDIRQELKTIIRLQNKFDEDRLELFKFANEQLKESDLKDMFGNFIDVGTSISEATAKRIFLLRSKDIENYTRVYEIQSDDVKRVNATHAATAALRRWGSAEGLREEKERQEKAVEERAEKRRRLQCELCGAEAQSSCSQCRQVYYCGEQCANRHWLESEHYKVCEKQ